MRGSSTANRGCFLALFLFFMFCFALPVNSKASSRGAYRNSSFHSPEEFFQVDIFHSCFAVIEQGSRNAVLNGCSLSGRVDNIFVLGHSAFADFIIETPWIFSSNYSIGAICHPMLYSTFL